MGTPQLTSPATGRRTISERVTQPLPHDADKRLRAYALAASAASVGLLALAQPANAQVVYTPANVSITSGDLFLDLNCGPKVQFWLANDLEVFSFSMFQEFAVNGSANASVIVDKNGPAELQTGSVIGSSRSFKNVHRNEQVLAQAFYGSYYGVFSGVDGNWANGEQAYLGLKFDIQGQVHYGWASLQVKASVDHRAVHVNAILLGYAYENTPNQPIQAGQTSSATQPGAEVPQAGTLGALARGAPSLGRCPDVEPHLATRRSRRPR